MVSNEMEKYLKDVNRHLKPMIKNEREDIIREIRSEIFELERMGVPEQDIIERLGPSKLLAKAYIEAGICEGNEGLVARIFSVMAYVFTVGFGGVFVLPCTVISGITFLVCSIICPIAGIVKWVAYLLGNDIQNIEFNIGNYTASAWEILPISFVLGALLFGAFLLMWKVTIMLIKYMAKRGKNSEN